MALSDTDVCLVFDQERNPLKNHNSITANEHNKYSTESEY